MNIISRDGKDYLQTYFVKVDNGLMDAGQFFEDVTNTVDEILKKYNHKNNVYYTYLDPKTYGGNLQKILNRYAATYFSPSFMKNYTTNPALSLMSQFFKESKSAATYTGKVFHTILERYYNLDERSRDKIYEIAEEEITDGVDVENLYSYLDGFIESGDYLTNQEMDDNIECLTEKYGRTKIYLEEFDYELPCPVSFIIDRLDMRPEGNYIVDYKTGSVDKRTGKVRSYVPGFDGYLGSMLLYKWAAEQEFGLKIDGGYLLIPAAKGNKFVELDFSKERQEEFIKQIDDFYKQFKTDAQTRLYKYTDKGFFMNPDAWAFRRIMNDNREMVKIPVEVEIGDSADSVL